VITFTIDLEDPTERYDADGRYVMMTRHILDICKFYQRRATFFVIGRVALAVPELLKEIAARGHEIAYHSHNHVSLTDETPQRFRCEAREDIDRFEQITGQKIRGFRAPRFSLTPESFWAVDVLAELGFHYSSSIMPTSISRFGFPGAPRVPFQWANGLIELPLPVAQFGPLRIPYLGGIYLYALPGFLARFWAHRADKAELLWTYTHPYDFDTKEKFRRMPHTPNWVSLILWLSRHFAEPKIRGLLVQGQAATLGERVDALRVQTYI
jgi:polysaccharide deacetylase family protein (PEP-CTERM system associated)